MTRRIQTLVRALDEIDYGLPPWDAPAGQADLGMDHVADTAATLPTEEIAAFAAATTSAQRRSLYRYSVRAASRSVIDADVQRCRAAFAAAVVAERNESEPRELMVNFAPHHVAATRLVGSAQAMFAWAARQLGREQGRQTLAAFGRRQDVTPASFGWIEVETGTGQWFKLDW